MPARFRRPRVLIVGCGDTGMHVLAALRRRVRVLALTSSPDRRDTLRAAGATPLLGNLDRAADPRRLRGLATRLLMLAPPPGEGEHDPRSANLARALRRPAPLRATMRSRKVQPGIVAPLRVVYGSTTGVYGDAQGRWIAEHQPTCPESARARRRVDAEARWRTPAAARARGGLAAWRATVLRIPGIYGRDRLPLDRLRRGLPRLASPFDVYTNHIDIEDLARIADVALWRGRGRVVHANDGQELKMGDYLDAVADAAGLPRPAAGTPDEVRAAVSPAMWSFMRESRRLANIRLRTELRVRLRSPTVEIALARWFPKKP